VGRPQWQVIVEALAAYWGDVESAASRGPAPLRHRGTPEL